MIVSDDQSSSDYQDSCLIHAPCYFTCHHLTLFSVSGLLFLKDIIHQQWTLII